VAPHEESPALDSSGSLDEEEGPETERGLTDKEQSEVRDAQRPRAPVVYEIIRLEGERELQRPPASLWWSGVAAGISIGFSFLSQAALGAGLPQSQWNHVLASLGYSVGFIIVILGRQQLFTDDGVACPSHASCTTKIKGLIQKSRCCQPAFAFRGNEMATNLQISLPEVATTYPMNERA
jgi:formate-nitrite transporter family protein